MAVEPSPPTVAPVARKVALVAGGSGLVGSSLLDALIASPEYSRVFALSRRPLPLDNARLANRIVNFERLDTELKGFVCQDAFCCLGTTIRTAGSEAAFRRVDFDTVLAFARAARTAQAQRLVVVSSVGADPDSANFYLRVKGETERALEALGFASLDILQPSLLLGMRGAERPLEFAAKLLMPLANPLLRGTREVYRGIPARTVAQAMIGATRSGRRGVYRYTYAGLVTLAQKGAANR
jgi:uncharacterized protein YbjT (DUF2867 family)